MRDLENVRESLSDCLYSTWICMRDSTTALHQRWSAVWWRKKHMRLCKHPNYWILNIFITSLLITEGLLTHYHCTENIRLAIYRKKSLSGITLRIWIKTLIYLTKIHKNFVSLVSLGSKSLSLLRKIMRLDPKLILKEMGFYEWRRKKQANSKQRQTISGRFAGFAFH